MAHTKVGLEGLLSDNDANGGGEVELQSTRSSRKRKQGLYQKLAREPNAKTMKTTEAGSIEGLAAATTAPPPWEPMGVEEFGLLVVEPAMPPKKRTKQVSFVQTREEDKELIRDAPVQGTTYSFIMDDKSTEVIAVRHRIPKALRTEEPSKTEQVPARALSRGTHTAPMVTKEPPKRIVSKLPPNKKMRRLNTITNEMEIYADGEETRKKECVQSLSYNALVD
jgi:hypothetical protein